MNIDAGVVSAVAAGVAAVAAVASAVSASVSIRYARRATSAAGRSADSDERAATAAEKMSAIEEARHQRETARQLSPLTMSLEFRGEAVMRNGVPHNYSLIVTRVANLSGEPLTIADGLFETQDDDGAIAWWEMPGREPDASRSGAPNPAGMPFPDFYYPHSSVRLEIGADETWTNWLSGRPAGTKSKVRGKLRTADGRWAESEWHPYTFDPPEGGVFVANNW